MSRLRLDLYQGGEAWGGWLDTILLPFRATIMGFETAPGYSASVGPLLLGLGLAALIGWSRSSDDYRAIGIVSILIVLPSTLVWMIDGRFSNYLLQTRLYFVIFPALAVLAGAGFSRIQRICLRPLSSGGGVRLGRIVGVLILLIYTLNLFELTVYTVRQNTLPVLLSIRSADQF